MTMKRRRTKKRPNSGSNTSAKNDDCPKSASVKVLGVEVRLIGFESMRDPSLSTSRT